MPATLSRELLSMIYALVVTEEIQARRQRASQHNSSASSSTLLKLARVDAWSYKYVTDVLYRSSASPDSLFSPVNVALMIHRLVTIDPKDVQTKRDHPNPKQMSVHDPCIWPYLQRYHNLRRITNITLPDVWIHLPSQRTVDAFLEHIGESGPIFRSIELCLACAASSPWCRPRSWQGALACYSSLFRPIRISFTASMSPSAGPVRLERLFGLARLFPDVPIRVPTRLDALNVYFRTRHVQPSNTWIQYVVDAPISLPTSGGYGRVDVHPGLEKLYWFIEHDLIQRPLNTQLRLDVVLQGVPAAELTRLSDQLVIAEIAHHPLRSKARVRTVDTFTGCEDRLRDLSLVTRVSDLEG